MSIWTCPTHGLTGPSACCNSASLAESAPASPSGATPATELTPFEEGAWIDEYHAKLKAIEDAAHACGDWGEDDDETYEQVYARLSDAKADLHNHVQGLLAELRAVASTSSASAPEPTPPDDVNELVIALIAGADELDTQHSGDSPDTVAIKQSFAETLRAHSLHIARAASPASETPAPEPTLDDASEEALAAISNAELKRAVELFHIWDVECKAYRCTRANLLRVILADFLSRRSSSPSEEPPTADVIHAAANWLIGAEGFARRLGITNAIDLHDALLGHLSSHSSGDDAGTPEAGPPLTPDLREALAELDALIAAQEQSVAARKQLGQTEALPATKASRARKGRPAMRAMPADPTHGERHRSICTREERTLDALRTIRLALSSHSSGDERPGSEPRLVERVAEAIYDAMRENDPEGKNRPWAEGGNSLKQDEARHRARKAIESDRGSEHAGSEPLTDDERWSFARRAVEAGYYLRDKFADAPAYENASAELDVLATHVAGARSSSTPAAQPETN